MVSTPLTPRALDAKLRSHRAAPWLVAAALYTVWTAATYLLEGLPRTLLRPEATHLRAVYAVVANLLVGLAGSAVVITWLTRVRRASAVAAGFRDARRTLLSIVIGALLGGAVYALQSPPARPAVVLINAFAQVFVVSAAEVVVCWSVTTVTLTAMLPAASAGQARALALVPAGILFGVYHIAHSPPFNTPGMILLLTGVGLVTGAFFLCTGEVLGTIIFHNFLALFGVLDALERSGRLDELQRLQPPLILTAIVTLLVLGGMRRLTRRHP